MESYITFFINNYSSLINQNLFLVLSKFLPPVLAGCNNNFSFKKKVIESCLLK